MKNYLQPLLIAIIIALILLNFSTCQTGRDYNQMYENSFGELTKERNKLNQEITKSSLIQVENEKMFLEMKSKDSTIIWLQEVVKDYKGKLNSATVLSNITESKGTSTTIITESDTVYKDSIAYIHSTYETSYNTEWDSGYVKANKDSIFHYNMARNNYEITMGYESQGFLKKRQPFVSIKNLNPNTETLQLKTYYREKRRKVGWIIAGSFLAGYVTSEFFNK